MVFANRPPARLFMALLVLCALIATGTIAAAQGDGGSGDGDSAQRNDDAPNGKKNKKNKGDDELPECDENGLAPRDDAADESSASRNGDQSEECTPPPRCEDNEVDLAPDADRPNCVSRAQLNRLLAGFEAAAAEEAQALDELAQALDDLEDLNNQLLELRLRLGEVQLRYAAAIADQGYAEIREAIAGESLSDVTSALRTEEDRLREQAVEAYMGGDEVALATAAAVIEINGFNAQQTAIEYASVVIGDQLATIDQVGALRNAVEGLTEAVARIEALAEADTERVAEIEAQVDDLIDLQRDLVTEAEAEAERIAETIAEIQTRKQSYADELRLKGAGGGAIGEALRVRQTGQVPPESSFGLLKLPLASTRLGSGFGPRVHPIFQDTRLHAGIDMSGNSGDPIVASAAGVVVVAEETSGYGNVVVVDHGNTLATLYAHMTADAVFVGQEVQQDDLLGFVGSTGFSTGPHLHYEVRIFGTPVDPMLYLDFTS